MSSSETKSKKAQGWWLGPVIVYLCMLGAMLLFSLILTPLKLSGNILTVLEQLTVYSITLIVVYLHVSRFEQRENFWESIGLRRKNLGQSLIWVFALFVVFTGILAIYWQTTTAIMGTDPRVLVTAHFEAFPDWYFAYAFFASFIPVALSEEIIFRGFMIDRFSVKGPIFAIVVSSLLFSSLHLWYAGFGVSGVPLYGGVFLLAVYWGIVYWKTGNIFGLIIMHGLNNISLSVTHFFGESALNVIESGIFLVGVICLGYLAIKYIRGLFEEIHHLVFGRGEIQNQ